MKLSLFILLALIPFTISCSTGKSYRSVKSMNYYKWDNIVKQEYDFSCGASALATLLNGYFGDNLTEKKILENMIEHIPEQNLPEKYDKGFSMEDLINVSERLGYDAQGVYLPMEALYKLKGPVILLIKTKTFYHFVVFKGTVDNRIFIADSSKGNMRMSAKRLFEIWGGYAIIIGKKGVGLLNDYPLKVKVKNSQPEVREARKALIP